MTIKPDGTWICPTCGDPKCGDPNQPVPTEVNYRDGVTEWVEPSGEPQVLTAERIKEMASKGHRCGWARMPSYYKPSEGCQCNCGISYDENWNPIISYLGRHHPNCKCKPASSTPPAPDWAEQTLESKYDQANGGIKAGDVASDAILRETRQRLEKRDGIYHSETQRNIGETDSAYQNRLRDEVEKLKVAPTPSADWAEREARELAELLEVNGEDRCAICYWPLSKSADKGCVRGNCSMRGGSEHEQAVRKSHRTNIEQRIPIIATLLRRVAERQREEDQSIVRLNARTHQEGIDLAAAIRKGEK